MKRRGEKKESMQREGINRRSSTERSWSGLGLCCLCMAMWYSGVLPRCAKLLRGCAVVHSNHRHPNQRPQLSHVRAQRNCGDSRGAVGQVEKQGGESRRQAVWSRDHSGRSRAHGAPSLEHQTNAINRRASAVSACDTPGYLMQTTSALMRAGLLLGDGVGIGLPTIAAACRCA